ncbi:MAG TPA: hypothetical protein VIY86_11025 [Pirellulaceae bacterium]
MAEFDFVCPNCNQRFRVSRKRVGARLRCPACSRILVVPSVEVAAVQLADRAARRQASTLEEFRVLDDDVLDDRFESDSLDPQPNNRLLEWSSPARRLLGGALGVAGIIAVYVAYQSGHNWGGRHVDATPRAIREDLWDVHGTIALSSSENEREARMGSPGASLVVAVPAGHRLDERIPSAVMSRRERESEEQAIAIRSLQLLGGDAAWSDPRGKFTLRLPRPGRYDFLIVTPVNTDADEIPKADLARVGYLFVPAFDLLQDRAYQLTTESVRPGKVVRIRVPVEGL